MARTTTSITDYSKCEVRSVIHFLTKEGVIPSEIHRRLIQVYIPNVMNRQRPKLAKWVRVF